MCRPPAPCPVTHSTDPANTLSKAASDSVDRTDSGQATAMIARSAVRVKIRTPSDSKATTHKPEVLHEASRYWPCMPDRMTRRSMISLGSWSDGRRHRSRNIVCRLAAHTRQPVAPPRQVGLCHAWVEWGVVGHNPPVSFGGNTQPRRRAGKQGVILTTRAEDGIGRRVNPCDVPLRRISLQGPAGSQYAARSLIACKRVGQERNREKVVRRGPSSEFCAARESMQCWCTRAAALSPGFRRRYTYGARSV